MAVTLRTVVVVDLVWVGSLPTYHKAICAAFLECGCRVISVSPNPAEVRGELEQSGQKHLANLVVEGVHGLPGRARLRHGTQMVRRVWLSFLQRASPGLFKWVESLSAWRLAGRAASATARPADLVFLPYLDAPFLSPAPGARRLDSLVPCSWSGLYLFPKWLRGGDPASREHAIRAFGSSRCCAVAVLDEGLRDRLAEDVPGKVVRVMPDFTDERVPSTTGRLEQRIRDAARGRPVVGLLGQIAARKGVDDLLRLAEAAMQAGDNWHFVVAGPLDRMSAGLDEPRLRRGLSGALTNVSFFDERIPDGLEFNAAVRALTVVWAAYPDFRHSSNMLTKAALLRRPVLVRDGHLLADRVRRFNLGEVASTADAHEMLGILDRINSGKEERLYSLYLDEHSRARLVTVAAQLLEDAGLG